jgi:hypothetical protein
MWAVYSEFWLCALRVMQNGAIAWKVRDWNLWAWGCGQRAWGVYLVLGLESGWEEYPGTWAAVWRAKHVCFVS